MLINKNTPYRGVFINKTKVLVLFCWLGSTNETFFLKRADCLGRQNHCDFLAVDRKSLLLEIRLKDTLCATQRKAHIVAELFTFTGEITF